MKLYKNYGMLSHEKQPYYTAGRPATDIYDVFNVDLPDGWEIANNVYGETLITSPCGDTYLANDIISNRGDSPALIWYDDRQRKHIITLVESI